MADKKIRFSAEENVSPIINKLKRDSEELGRGLIKDARAYTTSGKETLSYIEEQIKAIERRNRAEKQGRLLAVEAEKQRGGITPEQAKQQISQIGFESKTDEQQVTLLRELIDTVKQTSKREIVEDRKGVDKQISKSKTIDVLDPRGDELKILKETLQRQQLGEVKGQEREERDNFLERTGQRVNQAGQMVAGSQNQFYMAASIAGMIPLIGAGVSSFMQRALGAAQSYQTAVGGMGQLKRGGGGYYGFGRGLSSVGMTMAESLELRRKVSEAQGFVSEKGETTKDIAFFQKRTGLDMGALLEQTRLSRGGGLGAVEGTQRFARGLQAVGAMKGQDISLLSEYLPLLVSLQKEQVKIAGETNNEIATNLVAGIMSLNDSFKNPDVLRGVLPSLMGGLRQATSPQGEALQFRALSMMPGNRGKSLLDLEILRENPTLEYLGAYLEQIRGVSANQAMFTRNIAGEFGMSKTQAQQIAVGFGTSGFNLGDYSGQMGIKDVKTGAIGATSVLDRASAKWTQNFEKYGDALTKAIDSFTEENLPGEIKQLSEAISTLVELIKKVNTVLENTVGMGIGGVQMKLLSIMLNPGGAAYKAFKDFMDK